MSSPPQFAFDIDKQKLMFASMVRLRHFEYDGRARFITFSTLDRLPVLRQASYADAVADTIRGSCAEGGLILLAYVIMPEHVHLVAWPREGLAVGPIIGDIKRKSAKHVHELMLQDAFELLNRLAGFKNGQPRFRLWLPRCFDYNCRSWESIEEKIEYCHWNPVKRGLVSRPEDWPWSSIHSPTFVDSNT